MAILPDRRRLSFRLMAPLAFLVTGLVFVAGGLDIVAVQRWVASQGNAASVFFVLIGFVMMSTVVPKTAIAISAGALFGTVTGSLLLLLIATSAALANYAVGRWWLQERLEQKIASSNSVWARAVHDMANEAGFGFHLLMRLSPIPTMVLSYSMGASAARRRPYLIAAMIAVIPQSIWVYSGSSAMLASGLNSGGLAWLSTTTAIAFGVVVSIVVPREAMRRIRCLSERASCVAT